MSFSFTVFLSAVILTVLENFTVFLHVLQVKTSQPEDMDKQMDLRFAELLFLA